MRTMLVAWVSAGVAAAMMPTAAAAVMIVEAPKSAARAPCLSSASGCAPTAPRPSPGETVPAAAIAGFVGLLALGLAAGSRRQSRRGGLPEVAS